MQTQQHAQSLIVPIPRRHDRIAPPVVRPIKFAGWVRKSRPKGASQRPRRWRFKVY